ncbi:MAG: sialate O-acetylesterase, partial [Rubripirellula sp.]
MTSHCLNRHTVWKAELFIFTYLTVLLCSANIEAKEAGKSSTQAPLKVFILAGQSNMEGHGVVPANPNRNDGKGSLEYVAKKQPASEIGKWLNDDGTWVNREDVWIHYLHRHGKLSPSFGVREDCIGPELGFGSVVGNHFDEPVLLIKLAWGGKSLGVDFRPPSAPGDSIGDYYKALIDGSKTVIKDFATIFPEL